MVHPDRGRRRRRREDHAGQGGGASGNVPTLGAGPARRGHSSQARTKHLTEFRRGRRGIVPAEVAQRGKRGIHGGIP